MLQFQKFTNYICSDIKTYLPIYWELFINEVTKHTDYTLEHLELQVNDDHIYFYHNDGTRDNFFQFFCIVNRNSYHDNPEARMEHWENNWKEIPQFYDGKLTKLEQLSYLLDFKYIKSYIDAYIRDRKIDITLDEDKSCNKCDCDGRIYDRKQKDYIYCKDCGGLKIVLPGIKMIKMIRQ